MENIINDFKEKKNLSDKDKEFVNIKDASIWASNYLRKIVTPSNISYLIQYGKIKKYNKKGDILISISELKNYYDSFSNKRHWQEALGEDINWNLSFAQYNEAERTKHVHRLHPYKGKFIPQLVEYFLDSHTDEYKKECYFHPGDIVLDPFCGSGTTLVQANELGIHAIGIDISFFNALISEVKIGNHNIDVIKNTIHKLTLNLIQFQRTKNNIIFEEYLINELTKFNNKYFPSPDYKIKVAKGMINEYEYSREKEKEFLSIYNDLIQKFKIKIKQERNNTFLDKWFLYPVREEIDFLSREIKSIEEKDVKNVLAIILSRTVRSCRATTHADLATLKEPITNIYYCKKHGKICKPIFSIIKWWKFYTKDTLNRIRNFSKLRTNTFQLCLVGDSRKIDIYEEVKKKNPDFAELLKNQKIKGVFTSPPYVGLIDYHEQHAYAYEIFGFERKDDLEIGPLSKGQGEYQIISYAKDIAEVLINCKKYLKNNYDVFLVANDKFNLYPNIAELAGMKIVKQFKRPVLNRVEKDRNSPYTETIFHLKEK